jgi:GMP synthase-like glutamine amidotransferase
MGINTKPVAIFVHSSADGPAYFATFLQQLGLPYQEIRMELGDTVPEHADQFAGIALMGGPMSVNDDLPWIPASLAFIRDAVARDVPLLELVERCKHRLPVSADVFSGFVI